MVNRKGHAPDPERPNPKASDVRAPYDRRKPAKAAEALIAAEYVDLRTRSPDGRG